jgi:hypothetical protein
MEVITKISLLKELGLDQDIIDIIIDIITKDVINNAYEIIDIYEEEWRFENALKDRLDWGCDVENRTILYGFNRIKFTKIFNNPYIYIYLEGPCLLKDYCDVLSIHPTCYDYEKYKDYQLIDW